jgi:shikimate dehydrogenase
MGWPAKQSRSPKLHGYWISATTSTATIAWRIPPEEFPAFVPSLAKNGYVGGNVTMPHKDVAFAL